MLCIDGVCITDGFGNGADFRSPLPNLLLQRVNNGSRCYIAASRTGREGAALTSSFL
jgi:hypothetical protein